MEERYWIRHRWIGGDWEEVTKEEYVRTERAAGFHNTMDQPEEPATASFSNYAIEGTTINPFGAVG